MKSISLGHSALKGSRLAYGCWRIADGGPGAQAAGRQAVLAAYEAGFTLFDHADIYGDGVPERLFGQVLHEVSGMRDRIVIASKCGIRKQGEPKPDAPYRYDFSADYITRSCEQSLTRLGVESIDLYQLHRPDYLMHPAEVATAFTRLRTEGKVREFGVSNFRPDQVEALQSACPMPLIVNQVEISLANPRTLEDGTLNQCLARNMTALAWSPLAGGLLGDGARRLLPAQEAYRVEGIIAVLDVIAKACGITRTRVALAWLLRHPAGIIPIVGSTDPARIREAALADEIELTREEWYRLLEAARSERLP